MLNYSTSAIGGIRYEVLDLHGNPLPGHRDGERYSDDVQLLAASQLLYGDKIEDVVELQSPKRKIGRGLEARPVRLRFVMKDADLFSIRIRD